MSSELETVFAALAAMPGRDTAGLAVDADLQLELTTAAGASSTARVSGHGQQVRVQVERPGVLLAVLDRAEVGRAADLLAATGITLDVHGPHGRVATLGAGTSNRVGRVVTGSSRVAPVLGGAARLVWAGRPVRMSVVALSAVLVVLAAIGRLRRTRR